MDQVRKVGLSCYLVLLSIAKTGNKTGPPSWPDQFVQGFVYFDVYCSGYVPTTFTRIYVFVLVRMPPPPLGPPAADFCPRDNFWTTFWISFIFGTNVKGQICNLLYLSQKWSNCHEAKRKHIDLTLGFKCDHRVWPWPWLWPWIFKVKHGIGYISTKNNPIATKRKANISIEHQVWPWPWPWPWFFKVKYVICYISAKNGPIAKKQKENISI